jgi:hypothetical protein
MYGHTESKPCMFYLISLFLGLCLSAYSMELTQRAGSEPGLVGLMRIYQDYFPHIIVTATTSRRAAVFTVSFCQFSFQHDRKPSLHSRINGCISDEPWPYENVRNLEDQ